MLSLPDGYTELERLGDGSYSRVELIQKEENGSLYALKVLESSDGLSTAENEIDVLNLISSPFVVNLYDVFRGPNYCAIMEDACLGGSLRLRIASHDAETNPFMTEDILEITAQILLALKEIHSLGYAHRDLSPANILFVRDGENRLQLADFGIAARVSGTKDTVITKGSVGTPSYMSPEMRRGKYHDTMTDMYSLGVILFEMCELRLPKDGETESPSHPSLDALLENLLVSDPTQRATVDDCLSFPDIMDVLPKFQRVQRIKLTAYDWRPADNSDGDSEVDIGDINDIDDLPPIESYDSTSITPGRLLDNRHHAHWREPNFEDIQAAERAAQIEKEKVEIILKERKEQKIRQAQKQRAQSRITHQKWQEQKGDLAKHGAEYQKRLEQLKKQPRPGRRLIPNSVISGSGANSNSPSSHQSPFTSCTNVGIVSADEIEKVTFSLEKRIGLEKLSACIKALDANPLLSPKELDVTPRIFDVLSKLMRYRKDVFG